MYSIYMYVFNGNIYMLYEKYGKTKLQFISKYSKY